MATPPHEFVETRDIPDPTRSILEPTPQATPEPALRVSLEGAPARSTDDNPEPGQHDRPDLDPATSNTISSRRRAVPPPNHRSPEPDPILDSLPPWVARLGDGSWPVVRSDQLWGLVAFVLLVALVALALQRGPLFPSTNSVESGAPGSRTEDPAGPEADDAEPSAAARSSERLGESTDDEDGGLVSEPAMDSSTSSGAKTFTGGSRSRSTVTVVTGHGTDGGDRDTIDFDPGDDSGDGGDRDGNRTTIDDDGTTRSADSSDDEIGSTTFRRSTTSISSRSSTTRPTIGSTSTSRIIVGIDRITTTTASRSTTTTRSTTSSPTTFPTTTTSTTPTTGSPSTSSTGSTTITTAAASSTTGSTVAQSTTPEPGEPEPDPTPSGPPP